MSNRYPNKNHNIANINELPHGEKLPEIINTFRDNHYFLSSMYPLNNGVVTLDGRVVSSVEIGYQSEKFLNAEAREAVLRSVDGYAAKRLANKIEVEDPSARRADWESIKLDVMRWYVLQKFKRNPEITEELINTSNAPLIEANQWGDTFWGVSKIKGGGDRAQGENHLGRLLMETRTLFSGDETLISDYETELRHKLGSAILHEVFDTESTFQENPQQDS